MCRPRGGYQQFVGSHAPRFWSKRGGFYSFRDTSPAHHFCKLSFVLETVFSFRTERHGYRGPPYPPPRGV